jgi:hypothetical protein
MISWTQRYDNEANLTDDIFDNMDVQDIFM